MATAKGIDVWRGQVRFPAPMIDWVKQRAHSSFRSVNAELVEIVREAMKRDGSAKGNAPAAVTGEASSAIPNNQERNQ